MDPQQQSPMQQPSMTPPPMKPLESAEKKSSAGALIGAVIVVIIIIFGGLYFWGAQLEKQGMTQDELPFIPGDQDSQMMVEETATLGLPPTSSSDQVADIESDVESTDLDALNAQIDSDLNNMETSMQ